MLDIAEGRYDRQELITWWDQERLANSRVLVVGAGALGNEIVKSLVLLGVGHVEVVDMDVIEHSNLARGVFFRDGDEGVAKADVVSRRAGEVNPDSRVVGHVCRVEDLGVGYLIDFDLVIGGLDSREARLWVGQASRKLGKTWVDGAIEGLQGVARVFPPTGACYECTLGEVDRELIQHRRSCALLTADEAALGRTPTNVTTAAIVAAIQVQEATKILVGREDLVAVPNAGWTIVGETMESFRVLYDEDPDCMSHDSYQDILDLRQQTVRTIADALAAASQLRPGQTWSGISLEDELVTSISCSSCDTHNVVNRFRRALKPGDGECALCGQPATVQAQTLVELDSALTNIPLVELGAARADVMTLWGTETQCQLVVAGGEQTL